MTIVDTVIESVKKIVREDRKTIFNLLYYALIEAMLVLSIPMASSYVINSILSHAEISVFTLGIVVMTLFVIISILQILQSYIIEKFQQKIFLTTAIDISIKATDPNLANPKQEKEFIKYMNYFFDITSIQKFFPILLLDGVGIVIKIVVSLLLLWFFDISLFVAGVVFFTVYIILLFVLGMKGPEHAIQRSDAKHNVIYFLQHLTHHENSREESLHKLDNKLITYASARQRLFEIIIRQLTLTYIAEGIVFVGFMIIGSYLVFEGKLPVGEFIAAEIVVVSIIYALKSFLKQLDYIYDMTEGFHKVEKLFKSLGEHQ